MNILVCDDKEPQFERTKSAIGSRADVTPLVGLNLKRALTDLFERLATALNGSSGPDDEIRAEDFDGFDLVIVDNNLTGLELDGARLTAETIVGYLRAFTDNPYIVSLNKNPHVDFDLRYLFGDYQSLTDLALNTRHLPIGRLWNANGEPGFAPWYWPQLQNAVDRRKAQIARLDERFEKPVWEALGFPSEADEYLSLRAKSPLLSSKEEMRDATFQVFVDSSRALAPAEIRTLNKLAGEGSGFARRAVRRIAAHEVDRWLRRDVLGPQDVLIDLPHLLAQAPFLLGGRANELGHWNQVLMGEEPPFGLDEGMFEKHLARARFEQSFWAPTPCFWWPTLKSDEGLAECFFEAEGDWPDAVFCEDVSRFVLVSGKGESGSPLEFEAEIAGSWARRYIVREGDYQYSPRSRIIGNVK